MRIQLTNCNHFSVILHLLPVSSCAPSMVVFMWVSHDSAVSFTFFGNFRRTVLSRTVHPPPPRRPVPNWHVDSWRTDISIVGSCWTQFGWIIMPNSQLENVGDESDSCWSFHVNLVFTLWYDRSTSYRPICRHMGKSACDLLLVWIRYLIRFGHEVTKVRSCIIRSDIRAIINVRDALMTS